MSAKKVSLTEFKKRKAMKENLILSVITGRSFFDECEI